MDFREYCRKKQHSPYCSRAEAFALGQQSKQAEIENRTQVSAELAGELIRKRAEIDAIKSKVQELWTELDDRQSKEHIIEKCEAIIQEILK